MLSIWAASSGSNFIEVIGGYQQQTYQIRLLQIFSPNFSKLYVELVGKWTVTIYKIMPRIGLRFAFKPRSRSRQEKTTRNVYYTFRLSVGRDKKVEEVTKKLRCILLYAGSFCMLFCLDDNAVLSRILRTQNDVRSDDMKQVNTEL